MRIGIDTGGNFTDFVIFNPEDHSLHTFKILSTPSDPAEAILAGLQELPSAVKRDIIHGSTVATNALLERKGAPDKIPAASQSSMNNTLIGGWDEKRQCPFTYYETIGGGMGARSDSPGPSAMHSHMTNILNTPVEAMEYAYPIQVLQYAIRRDSGGNGKHNGGDGIQRDLLLLNSAQASLLTERRKGQPYGLKGGNPGASEQNIIIRNGQKIKAPDKGPINLIAGDILSIRTPGGGGFGKAKE